GEITAVDVVHAHVVDGVGEAEVVHAHEPRVGEASSEPGLADQQALEVRLPTQLGSQQLERHGLLPAARAEAMREVNLGHATGAETTHDLVGAESSWIAHAR